MKILLVVALTVVFIRACLGEFGLRTLFNQEVERDQYGNVTKPNSLW